MLLLGRTLGVVGALLAGAGGDRVGLVGLADQRQAVEVVPPEVLLRNAGIREVAGENGNLKIDR